MKEQNKIEEETMVNKAFVEEPIDETMVNKAFVEESIDETMVNKAFVEEPIDETMVNEVIEEETMVKNQKNSRVICPGKSDNEYCEGMSDCWKTDFCECPEAQKMCKKI